MGIPSNGSGTESPFFMPYPIDVVSSGSSPTYRARGRMIRPIRYCSMAWPIQPDGSAHREQRHRAPWRQVENAGERCQRKVDVIRKAGDVRDAARMIANCEAHVRMLPEWVSWSMRSRSFRPRVDWSRYMT